MFIAHRDTTPPHELDFHPECTLGSCSRRAVALAIVGGYENLPGSIIEEIKACDGTPCMLSTRVGSSRLEALIQDESWDMGTDNAA